ncbi:hypothetical protein DERP_002879 [Dermatophagoides pteronyssinus]|uniref:Uncharacterized protein n=1 Tax=Dermatophagoides pteronyssinus TaxID=6956 RepID=A0ABQ8JW22_DERPT|nr:hypothetical protein DERP_002879 [Dermatophagoides pteronyssinus]
MKTVNEKIFKFIEPNQMMMMNKQTRIAKRYQRVTSICSISTVLFDLNCIIPLDPISDQTIV